MKVLKMFQCEATDLIKKLSSVLRTLLLLTVIALSSPYVSNAENKRIDIDMKYYELDEDSNYKLSSSYPAVIMDHDTLGSVSIGGKINRTYSKGKVPAYEVADDELISIKFSYNDALKKAGEKEWHLYNDSKKEANGIAFDEKIGNGAIILQTSFDGERWATNYKKPDIANDIFFNKEDYINDIQLLTGCYYRVIVVYETQIQINPTKVQFAFWETPIGIPDNEYMKNAEVYEFYASYKGADDKVSENIETLALGKTQAVTVDNGFIKNINMDSDDPHLGWNLGQFVVGGFTTNKENNNGDTVFLKNAGDKITLWFNMDKNADIDKVNGKDNLSINMDTNGYDFAFNVPPQNFKRGTLIVRFTDYKGNAHDPIIYTNFLEALAYPGADTKIQLFEEGDYEVSLDYEILNNKGIDKLYNYKIAFNFQIRNSNTVVYPKDKGTGAYLANDSVTENGFVLDWAKSRYLDINVKLSQWTKGANGYTEDVVFNRSAKESDVYTKTGIYTITVTNPTTDPNGNNPTIKKIYVGSDNVLIASMNAKNSSYTINQISNLVENEGYEISEKGELIPPPVVTEPESETTSSTVEVTTNTTTESTTPTTTTAILTSETNGTRVSTITTSSEATPKDDTTTKSVIPFIGIGSAGLIGILVAISRKNKK